jgi:excisionase family DNA binding protein
VLLVGLCYVQTESKVLTVEYLTLKQAADALPISPKPHRITVYQWIKRGVCGVKLRSQKIGGRVFVRRDDLDSFLHAINRPQLAGGAR